jgi:hypothetical protein
MGTLLEVRTPTDLVVGASEKLPDRLLSELILSTGLRALMQASGHLCFDGGAVEYRGEALLLIGRSSSGKSSLLARLCQLGGRFLSDDLVVVRREDSESLIVRRGALRTKLWPDALSWLDEDSFCGGSMAPWLGKQVGAVDEGSSCRAAKLGAVVVCRTDRVSEPALEKVDFRRSIPLLLAASSRLDDLVPRESLAERTALLMCIAARVPVFCLTTNPASCTIDHLMQFFEGQVGQVLD